MDDPFRRPALASGVFYRDHWAALDFLEKAFGFERTMVITDKDGNLAHSEMRFGDSLIYVGSEWADFVASPASIGGKNSQSIHVHLQDGTVIACGVLERKRGGHHKGHSKHGDDAKDKDDRGGKGHGHGKPDHD